MVSYFAFLVLFIISLVLNIDNVRLVNIFLIIHRLDESKITFVMNNLMKFSMMKCNMINSSRILLKDINYLYRGLRKLYIKVIIPSIIIIVQK